MRWAIALLGLAACLGTTPQDRERNGVVSVGESGPLHNPGTPCLLCHGFEIAGTVYRRATDDTGVAGVTVQMTDHAGHVFSAVTNASGNFFVKLDTHIDAPVAGPFGQAAVPWSVEFPVLVQVTSGGITRKMRNQIGQWGSCAECHTPDPGATSNGRIYAEAP